MSLHTESPWTVVGYPPPVTLETGKSLQITDNRLGTERHKASMTGTADSRGPGPAYTGKVLQEPRTVVELKKKKVYSAVKASKCRVQPIFYFQNTYNSIFSFCVAQVHIHISWRKLCLVKKEHRFVVSNVHL